MNAFTLSGTLTIDTASFTRGLKDADALGSKVAKNVDDLEAKTKQYGFTSAVAARQIEKYNQTIDIHRGRLSTAAVAYAKGDVSAKQYTSTLLSFDRAMVGVNNRLKDHQARLEDAARKQASFKGPGFLSEVGSGINGALGILGAGVSIERAISLAKEATDKAIEQSRANRLLAASATEAGLAQGVLVEKNKQLATSFGLSNVAAADTTALIARLATFSGNSSPQRISSLITAFSDVASARGIGTDEMSDLVQNILSGRDQGLHKLGISNIGILKEQYAQQLSRTSGTKVSAQDLTLQQTSAAVVNELLKKSATFAGAAEMRMNSLEGQVAKTNAAFENLSNTLSVKFATSGPFQDALTQYSNLLGQVSIDIDTVNKKLAEGKSPAQIAKETYPGPSVGDYVSAYGTKFINSLALSDNPLGFFTEPDWMKDAADPEKLYGRRLGEFTQQIAAQQGSNNQQLKAAGEQKVANAMAKYEEEHAKNVEAAIKAQEKALEKARQKAAEYGRELVQAAKSGQSLFAELAPKDNPIARIFAEGEIKLRQMNETLKLLPAGVRAYAAELIRSQVATDAFKQKLDNRVQAFGLRSEARQFSQGYLDENNPNIAAEARYRANADIWWYNRQHNQPFQGDPAEVYQKYLQEEQVKMFQSKLDDQLGSLGSRYGLSAEQKAIYDKKINALTEGIDPSRLTSDQRDIAASSREREATRLQKEGDEARNTQKRLVSVLDALEGQIERGLAITIRNEAPGSARVSPGSRATVEDRYR